VPVCWRFGILLFMMCVGAITIHFTMLWKQGKLSRANRLDGTIMNSTSKSKRFFLDIGPMRESASLLTSMATHTKMLEEKGWRGVCADPFPIGDHNRSCNLVTLPVGAATGAKVRLADWRECEGRSFFSKAFFSCPDSERTVVSISDILRMTKAPQIIDFIHIDDVVTGGHQVDVLKSFPFEKFCARSWSVKHNNEVSDSAQSMLVIKKIFKAHHCRLRETEAKNAIMYWARCPCGKSKTASIAEASDRASEAPHAMEQGKVPHVLPQLMRSAQTPKAAVAAVQRHAAQRSEQDSTHHAATGVALASTQGIEPQAVWMTPKGEAKSTAQRTPWRKRAARRAAQRTVQRTAQGAAAR